MIQRFFQTAYIGFLLAVVFTISGCKPDEANTFKTTLNFKSTFGGEQIVLNKLVTTSVGDSIKFTMSKILLSEIDLLKLI